MSDDAKFCWLAAAVAVLVWGLTVGGVVWQYRLAQASQRAPQELGEAK